MLATSLLAAVACAQPPLTLPASEIPASESVGYAWRLPHGFPEPRVPADNPMSEAKVELGRRLFYDTRLSGNNSMSCATCHRQELAFTDGRRRPVGITGVEHPRSAMSLANVAYAVSLNWDEPEVGRLEEQLRTPIFGHDPIEMGAGRSEELIAKLNSDWLLNLEFRAAFPEDPQPLNIENLARAIAAFERTLLSGDSAFDRYVAGDEKALPALARRGMQLFYSKRTRCVDCHDHFTFSSPIVYEGSRDHRPLHHNNGLYDVGGGAYPKSNPGLVRHTGMVQDQGRFKAPTLRNIEVTAPFMHDGSLPTLESVVDHYSAGGSAGRNNPFKAPEVGGFALSTDEKAALVAFLRSLTDHKFLSDPRFGSPK